MTGSGGFPLSLFGIRTSRFFHKTVSGTLGDVRYFLKWGLAGQGGVGCGSLILFRSQ